LFSLAEICAGGVDKVSSCSCDPIFVRQRSLDVTGEGGAGLLIHERGEDWNASDEQGQKKL